MFRIVINIYCITLVYGDFSKLSTLLIFSETGIFVYFYSLNKKDSGVHFFLGRMAPKEFGEIPNNKYQITKRFHFWVQIRLLTII